MALISSIDHDAEAGVLVQNLVGGGSIYYRVCTDGSDLGELVESDALNLMADWPYPFVAMERTDSNNNHVSTPVFGHDRKTTLYACQQYLEAMNDAAQDLKEWQDDNTGLGG